MQVLAFRARIPAFANESTPPFRNALADHSNHPPCPPVRLHIASPPLPAAISPPAPCIPASPRRHPRRCHGCHTPVRVGKLHCVVGSVHPTICPAEHSRIACASSAEDQMRHRTAYRLWLPSTVARYDTPTTLHARHGFPFPILRIRRRPHVATGDALLGPMGGFAAGGIGSNLPGVRLRRDRIGLLGRSLRSPQSLGRRPVLRGQTPLAGEARPDGLLDQQPPGRPGGAGPD